jgi:hypothetical protein
MFLYIITITITIVIVIVIAIVIVVVVIIILLIIIIIQNTYSLELLLQSSTLQNAPAHGFKQTRYHLSLGPSWPFSSLALMSHKFL